MSSPHDCMSLFALAGFRCTARKTGWRHRIWPWYLFPHSSRSWPWVRIWCGWRENSSYTPPSSSRWGHSAAATVAIAEQRCVGSVSEKINASDTARQQSLLCPPVKFLLHCKDGPAVDDNWSVSMGRNSICNIRSLNGYMVYDDCLERWCWRNTLML